MTTGPFYLKEIYYKIDSGKLVKESESSFFGGRCSRIIVAPFSIIEK